MKHLSVTEDTENTPSTKPHNGSHLRSSELRPAKVFELGRSYMRGSVPCTAIPNNPQRTPSQRLLWKKEWSHRLEDNNNRETAHWNCNHRPGPQKKCISSPRKENPERIRGEYFPPKNGILTKRGCSVVQNQGCCYSGHPRYAAGNPIESVMTIDDER